MISNLEYNIYKAIEQDKKLTEIYIGYQEFDWFFTKASYSATCTEAIDFTLFDKTICGLLQIEEHLSLEQIGEILGFNVIDNPTEKKYKDLAEYEILKEALQSLEEFEMIEGGDIYFSYCTLTPTGKEYVKKGKKFKIHENKKFRLFFDNTNNDHSKAKENFEFLKAEKVYENENSIDYDDEDILKTFAEHQIPEIYNPEKINSFKDTILQNKAHYKTTLFAIFLLDINTGKHRTLVYEKTSSKISNYFTVFIQNNQEFDTQYFNSFIPSKYKFNEKAILNEKHFNNLNNFQDKIDVAIQENENFTQIIEEYYNNIKFIETELFILKFPKFIENSESEIWLSLDKINPNILDKLNIIFKNIAKQDKFLFVNIIDDNTYENEIEKLINFAEKSKNIYMLAKDSIEDFDCFLKINNNYVKYSKSNLSLPIEFDRNNYFIEKSIISKTNLINNEKIELQRNDFADNYFNFLYENIKQQLINFDYEKQHDKQILSDLKVFTQKLNPFSEIEKYNKQIINLENLQNAQIIKIKEKRKSNIIQITSKNIQELDSSEYTYKNLERIKSKINNEKEKCFDFELDLFIQVDKKINFIEKEIELISKRKSIIIDTNILIEEPNIIKIIGSNQTIVFSGKVIDELDKLKTRKELKEKAQNAIRNIRNHQKDKNIRFNTSKVSNLPDDFDKKSPDNMILSVAIQYKKYNPVLLTNDKGLQIKSEMLEIPAKTIEELKILLKSNTQITKNHKPKNKKRK